MNIRDLDDILLRNGQAALADHIARLSPNDAAGICAGALIRIPADQTAYQALNHYFGIENTVSRAVTPLPPPTPFTGPIVDLNGNDVTPLSETPMPKRLWGETHGDSQIAEIIGVSGSSTINTEVAIALVDIYRKLAYETGPTALNKAVIGMMIKNAKDNQNLGPTTKMIRDQDIVSLMTTLRGSSNQIFRRFPGTEQLSSRYIYKRSTSSTDVAALDMDRHAHVQVTGDMNGWVSVNMAFHRYHFLYKRDPSIPTADVLSTKLSSMYKDLGCYVTSPTSSPNHLYRVDDFEVDTFNGRIIAVTQEGKISLPDPVFFYRSNFHKDDKVKIVRDSKLRRSLYREWRRRGVLNRACLVSSVSLGSSGRLFYNLEAMYQSTQQPHLARSLGQSLRHVPVDLIIPAKRTKAFGSL